MIMKIPFFSNINRPKIKRVKKNFDDAKKTHDELIAELNDLIDAANKKKKNA